MATAHDVAAAIIERCPADPLKLQKLVYFVVGEHLALTGRPIFDDPVEAWDYGPVVHSLYRTYQGSAEVIATPVVGSSGSLTELELACVDSVVAEWGARSSAALVRITHQELPWLEHYAAGRTRTRIPDEEICDWFRRRWTGTSSPEVSYDTAMAKAAMKKWVVSYTPAQQAVIRRLAAEAKPAPRPPR